MARADLSSLLGNLTTEQALPAAEAAPATQRKAAREHPEPAAQPDRARPGRGTQGPETGTIEPTYLTFVRKDTRLREDQLEALTREARRLNRAKRNNGLRITENTLIRIGVDLLLERIGRAEGNDEDSLRRSLR